VISAERSRVLVDLGWPGMIGALKANLTRFDIPLNEIRYAIATHYHIDHAGAAQDLKNAGVPLLVIDVQRPFIPLMKRFTKPDDHYTDIATDDNVVIPAAESRALLLKLGISGEIVLTPGHSDDSVSLLLDHGPVFTGDLTHPSMIGQEDPRVVHASWHRLKNLGARHVYAGHGPVRPLPV
jgi:glyoxylase-like metal-dependent hydrolase (beta-lactamase superfamily II)